MTTAAIYARYSTDLQRERSIDDQIALCRDYAARNSFRIVATFDDKAKSGDSMINRDGLLAALAAAKAGKFEVLLVEELDRISRDQEDLPGVYKRLQFAGVQICAVHGGVANQTSIGVRGLLGALFLDDLKNKVRRGMAGVVRDGRNAGGRAYGYRPIPGDPGKLVIDEVEAEIVRRIFSEYVSGLSPRNIAERLNAEGIAAPRGEVWSASTINGNSSRGHGILTNPLYSGKIVWNRVRMVKDPDTGRRVSRTNPVEEWHTNSAQHLQIVDSELFEAAQSRKRSRALEPTGRLRQPRHLFSGLLKCGCCGGGMSIKDRDHGRLRIICTRSRESGSCDNRRVFYMDEIEHRIARGLRKRLGNKQAIAHYLQTYNAERRRLAGTRAGEREKKERRLEEVDKELDRAHMLLIKGVLDEQKGALQITALKEELRMIREELESLGKDNDVLQLHPTAVAAYLNSLDDLDAALRSNNGVHQAETFSAIRDMVDRIIVRPADNREIVVQLDGTLSRLIGGDHFPDGRMSGGKVVAEEGFEPPTRGL